MEGGRARGFLCLNQRSSLLIRSGSVILASGGAGSLFYRHSTPRGLYGDGQAAALRAGAGLVNMEFVQFFPVALDSQTPSPRHKVHLSLLLHEAVKIVNGKGEDIVAKHLRMSLADAIVLARDELSRSIALEAAECDAFLDLTAISDKEWEKKILQVKHIRHFLEHNAFDWRHERVPITPMAHYTMGGLRVCPA